MLVPARGFASLSWQPTRKRRVAFTYGIAAALLLMTALPPAPAQSDQEADGSAGAAAVAGVEAPQSPLAECETAVRLAQVMEEAGRQDSPAAVALTAARDLANRACPAGDGRPGVAIGSPAAPSWFPILI
jgi:hypothetical protein